MKNIAILAVAASAALVSATEEIDTGGITINPDGSYTCEKPNAAYCAGDSLKTDIIIRCYGTVGQAGRCSNNLAGQPPVGVSIALCHQTSSTEGDAACEKNCVVYGGSGNGKGTFTLPAEICTPTYTATTSSASATSSVSSTSTPSYPTSVSTTSEESKTKTWTKTHKPPPYTHTWTKPEDCTTDYTKTKSWTHYYPTAPSSSATYVPSSVIYPTNTTISKTTVIPTGPTTTTSTTTTPTPVPAGAVHNSAAGGALAFVAFVAAWIL